jgi:hypothetical protein
MSGEIQPARPARRPANDRSTDKYYASGDVSVIGGPAPKKPGPKFRFNATDRSADKYYRTPTEAPPAAKPAAADLPAAAEVLTAADVAAAVALVAGGVTVVRVADVTLLPRLAAALDAAVGQGRLTADRRRTVRVGLKPATQTAAVPQPAARTAADATRDTTARDDAKPPAVVDAAPPAPEVVAPPAVEPTPEPAVEEDNDFRPPAG